MDVNMSQEQLHSKLCSIRFYVLTQNNTGNKFCFLRQIFAFVINLGVFQGVQQNLKISRYSTNKFVLTVA